MIDIVVIVYSRSRVGQVSIEEIQVSSLSIQARSLISNRIRKITILNECD